MSDTPRTDRARLDEHDPAEAMAIECANMECELTDAKHRIRTLIEERDTARPQADLKWKLREEFEALVGCSDVAIGVDRIKEAKLGAARYEVVRKMKPSEFELLFWRCISEDLRFDDEVDRIGGLK